MPKVELEVEFCEVELPLYGVLGTSLIPRERYRSPFCSFVFFSRSAETNLATKCATHSRTKAVGEPGLAAKPLLWHASDPAAPASLEVAAGWRSEGHSKPPLAIAAKSPRDQRGRQGRARSPDR